ITIHKVQQGEGKAGCDPRGVQILYKESRLVGGNPDGAYLAELLSKHGLEATDGAEVSVTPMRYLCVRKPGEQLKRDDVLAILEQDQEIDLGGVHRPEGHLGSD